MARRPWEAAAPSAAAGRDALAGDEAHDGEAIDDGFDGERIEIIGPGEALLQRAENPEGRGAKESGAGEEAFVELSGSAGMGGQEGAYVMCSSPGSPSDARRGLSMPFLCDST